MAVTKRVRFEVLRRDNHTCRYCGATAPASTLVVDHVIPVALGGGDSPSNLVAACRDCNSGKTSIAPDQPLVEQVTDDALRWARAMSIAAAERAAAYEQNQKIASQFRAMWDSWKTDNGAGTTVPLPAGWSASVRSLIAAGLTLVDFEELIEVAMESRARDEFRYFCGCCWTRIREAQERATEILSEQEQASPATNLEQRVQAAFAEASSRPLDALEAAEQRVWSDWFDETFGVGDDFDRAKHDFYMEIRLADNAALKSGQLADLPMYPEAVVAEVRKAWQQFDVRSDAVRTERSNDGP